MKVVPLFLFWTWSGATCYMLVFRKRLLILKAFCLFYSFCINHPLISFIGCKLLLLFLLRPFKLVDQWGDRPSNKRVGKKRVFLKKKLKILKNLDYTWQKPEVACELSISWKAGIDQCHCIEDNGGLSAEKLTKGIETKWSFPGKELNQLTYSFLKTSFYCLPWDALTLEYFECWQINTIDTFLCNCQ